MNFIDKTIIKFIGISFISVIIIFVMVATYACFIISSKESYKEALEELEKEEEENSEYNKKEV